MTSLHNINPDGAYDGQQRSLEDFQFDLENILTMSQLVGKSAEERNVASVMLDILDGTKIMTAAEVAAEVVTEAPKVSGQKVLCAVLAENTAERARMIVREDNTKNGSMGSGCETGLVETLVRRVSQKCFNTVGPARSRSKTCGAIGSRKSRSFHQVQ